MYEIIAFAISLILSIPGDLIAYYAMKGEPLFKMSFEEYQDYCKLKNQGKIMTKTKWWFTYELTNGNIKVGEIINDPIEKIRIKTLFSDAKVDLWLRKDEALAVAYGIIKTVFEIERKKIEKLDDDPLN